MKKRLTESLPTVLLLGTILVLLSPPGPLLAQQSRRSDSDNTSRTERTERNRTTSRERAEESRSSRGDSEAEPARRAPTARPDEPAPARDERRAAPARAADDNSSGRGGSTDRSREEGENSRVRVFIGRERGSTEGRQTSGAPQDRDSRDSNSRDERDRGESGRDERERDRGDVDRDRDGRDSDGREATDRNSDGRERDGRDSDNRDSDGRESDGRDSDGRDRDGRDSDGRDWRDPDRDDRHYRDRRDRDRDYRDRDRRHDGGPIIDRHPRNKHWGRPVPRIHIDLQWPWVHRHQRKWSPRYRYRQVVFVDVGWSGSRRESRLDLRTFYRHRVIDASPQRAVVDILIDRIEIYEDGYFVGEVHRIPDEMARIRAVVDRRYGVEFNRDVFLLGDPYAGFEMISTRYYDGYVLDRYRPSHGVRVAALDLRRERVVPVRRSKFFDPNDFSGFVPMNLLPEDAGWLIDYGYDSYSGHYWGDDDRYYYGFSDADDYTRLGDDRAYYSQTDPRGATTGREEASRATPEREALSKTVDETYETEAGATIRLKRESFIERME